MTNNISFFDNKITTFLLKLLVVLMSIIIVFNSVFKPKRVEAATIAFTASEVVALVATIGGIAISGVDTCINLYRAWKGDDTATEDDMVEYFNQQITIDGDGNYIVSDDGMVTINGMKEAYENDVTYQNMYLPSAVQIDASTFNTKSAYSKFYALVESNPDKIFSICRATHTYNNYRNISGWTIRVHDADVCGVSSEVTSGMGKFPVNVFDSEWQSNFSWTEFYLCDAVSNSKLVYKDKEGNWVELETVDEVSDFDFSLATNTYTGGATTKFGSTHASWNSSVDTQNQIFTDFNGAFPVYVSVTAMKQGTSVGTCGQFLPGYAPGTITDNSITQTEINDYSTNYNYYYGTDSGGSGSNDSGGSSGSWLDSLLNGIGSLGNAIMSIISKIIEILGQAIELIVSTITDFTDLVTGGFTDFLTAVFPFLPEEFVKIIGLGLVLAVFGVIIRCFIG